MNTVLRFDESQYIDIEKISIIGSFNDFNPEKGVMKKEEGYWSFETNLQPGEYHYKYLINEKLRVNDPYNNIYEPDENEELWSVIIVNDQSQRMYNNEEYTLDIEEYNLSSKISDNENIEDKKYFFINQDDKVVARFKFKNITGIHAITALWYTPDGELFEYSEEALCSEDINELVTLWFWLDISETEKVYKTGNWKLKLFVDGEYVLEDDFNIENSNSYKFNSQFV